MFKTTGPKYEEEQDIYIVSLHSLTEYHFIDYFLITKKGEMVAL